MQIDRLQFSNLFKTLSNIVTGSVLALLLTPIVVASERYPTETEVQQLRIELSRRIQELRSGELSAYLDDYRTDEERQQYQEFVNTWSIADPAVVPFLGMWGGYEQRLSIYPSSMKGQVCIIEHNEIGFSGFATGEVINNATIRTSDRKFIIRSGAYLGVAGIYNGQPWVGDEIPFRNPYLLSVPNRITFTSEELEFAGQAEQALQKFKEEGCLVSSNL